MVSCALVKVEVGPHPATFPIGGLIYYSVLEVSLHTFKVSSLTGSVGQLY